MKRIFKHNKKEQEVNDILLRKKKDRRLLPNVPDSKHIRNNVDRRGMAKNKKDLLYFSGQSNAGDRYFADCEVKVICYKKGVKKQVLKLHSVDISATGMLIECTSLEEEEIMKHADKILLRFEIAPGSMPEGYEQKIKVYATVVRGHKKADGTFDVGVNFCEDLPHYINRIRGKYLFIMSAFMLVFISLFVIFMRAESIIYFQFNKVFYMYSMIAAVFLLSRYFFGMLYRPIPVNEDYTPGVTIIIPCFNEEEWIDRTILSCMNQAYPPDKLQVIVVDDFSADRSVEVIKDTIEKIRVESHFIEMSDRISYIVQPQNMGKRDALAAGTFQAKHELVVFVDSDSFLDPFAIKNLVQPFQDPKMGGVAGRTDVANVFTNWMTKMQTTRYYVAFRIMKAAEAYFDAVTCLSGPLACYRKDIVLEFMDEWLNQQFLGRKATFGDDRSLTNMVLRKYRTNYQDSAICSTIVPNKQKILLKQQMRWKRSWLRESFIAAGYIWKKEPFAAIFFYIGLLVPFLAPIIVGYNLIYVPVVHRVFPLTFLIGLFMMAMLMSFTYLLFRRSRIWLFSLFFVLYYEFVLLWQMPVAWVTFWKSTWGTRMTPEDIKEAERKKEKKMQKERKKNKKGEMKKG